MAEINIRLIYNLESGKKDIFIDFESDADALPIEHEDAHRDIIQQLIGQNVLTEDDLGKVVVNRVEPQRTGQAATAENAEPEAESASN